MTKNKSKTLRIFTSFHTQIGYYLFSTFLAKVWWNFSDCEAVCTKKLNLKIDFHKSICTNDYMAPLEIKNSLFFVGVTTVNFFKLF